MDKNNSNKLSNFLKKEGFYLILFICLCVLATVAVVTTRNTKRAKNNLSSQQSKVENELGKEVAKNAEQPYSEYDNALQVKKNDKNQADNSKVTNNTAKSSKSTAQVSKNVDSKFSKPVDGKVARTYSEEPVFWKSTDSYRPNFGIDIKCNVGKPVAAVMDGKVENIEKSTQDGVKVTVNHQNGLKTVYSNLDPKITVTKGQMIKKGTKLGLVGKTTLRALYETYGDHLHFAVLKDGKFVNPDKYIKY